MLCSCYDACYVAVEEKDKYKPPVHRSRCFCILVCFGSLGCVDLSPHKDLGCAVVCSCAACSSWQHCAAVGAVLHFCIRQQCRTAEPCKIAKRHTPHLMLHLCMLCCTSATLLLQCSATQSTRCAAPHGGTRSGLFMCVCSGTPMLLIMCVCSSTALLLGAAIHCVAARGSDPLRCC